MLLNGGPALSVEQFENYKPTTTVGVSLSMTAPTGLYRSDKVLNLGSDRWSFKPEISLSHLFGPEQKWQLNIYANVYFFTDNTSYHRTEILRQEPLPGIEGQMSYAFTDMSGPRLIRATPFGALAWSIVRTRTTHNRISL
jgi:hypothetical protein